MKEWFRAVCFGIFLWWNRRLSCLCASHTNAAAPVHSGFFLDIPEYRRKVGRNHEDHAPVTGR